MTNDYRRQDRRLVFHRNLCKLTAVEVSQLVGTFVRQKRATNAFGEKADNVALLEEALGVFLTGDPRRPAW